MKITNTAIKFRTSILVLTLLISLAGLYSYITLPKESAPSIEIPYIVVTTIYPGASPDDIESLITKPIEQEVKGITGIDVINSTSTEGVSSIVIEFLPDVTIDEAQQKVRDKVDLAKPELPTDAEDPIISEIDITDFPIMSVNLAADYSLAQLKEVAEDLQDELESISTILEVNLVGGLEREVQVNVDLNALQAYNLSFNDISAAIQQENANIPGGSVDADRLNYLVRVNGLFTTAEEIQDLVIEAPGGTPVYVRDVADVDFGFKERESYARLKVLRREMDDGSLVVTDDIGYGQVITLNVKKRPGENILEAAASVRDVLDTFPLPKGTQVLITGDQSEEVESLVTDLENNIIAGIIFVVAVLLFFLGVRNAMLVGIAIPLSMLLSFIVFMIVGQTLNFVILFSLIIALGMLVDNAVVIVENIYRYREEGHSNWEAAKQGTAEVGMAVVASTATTVAVFIPMMFWPGLIGEFMSYMPMTLIVTLTASLFVAIVINPVITGFLVKVEGQDDNDPNMEASPWPRRIGLIAVGFTALVIALANPITLAVLVVGGTLVYLLYKFVFKPIADGFVRTGLPRIVERYRGFLHWMLERDYTVKRAYLRNMGALSAFTLGFVLLIMGAAVGAFAGQVAGMVLLVPGGVLLLAGIIGIFLHTFESIFLGRWSSVKVGLIFGGVMFLILLLMYLSPKPIEFITIIELMIAPVLVIIVGILGMLFGGKRDRLILTDNRARLMNGVLGTLFGILLLFAVAPTGVEFFPDTDPNQIQVIAEGPLGTHIEASNRLSQIAQNRTDELLAENPQTEENVKNILVNVGVGGDAQFGGGSASAERSRVTMNLVDFNDRNEKSTITLAKIRDQLVGIPGAELKFEKDQQGPPTGKPVNIEIIGPNFDQLVRIADEAKEILRRGADAGRIPGLVDVQDNLNTGRPELQVRIDRERAARFGLNTSQIASTVRAAVNGIDTGTWRTGEDEYDIVVRLQEADRQSLESVRNLTIKYEGQQIPISAVADFEIGSGLGSITRKDVERVVVVEGDASPGFNAQQVLIDAQAELAEFRQGLPAGYAMSYTGESEEQQEAFGFLTTALLIGVSLIFMILIAQFNSVSTPFIIMVAVGLSLIGVLLGLILTRTPFGLFTFIGIISLAGIVVNNNIVLIDYIMQLRARGMEKQAAVIEGGATRLRPVLLTAFTTVLGLIPLTFGINIDFVGLLTAFDPNLQFGSQNTQFWGPMGTAIISGLVFATFLTLVIVPVMYSIFDSLSVRASELFSKRPRAHEPVAVVLGPGNGTNGKGGLPQPQAEPVSGQ